MNAVGSESLWSQKKWSHGRKLIDQRLELSGTRLAEARLQHRTYCTVAALFAEEVTDGWMDDGWTVLVALHTLSSRRSAY